MKLDRSLVTIFLAVIFIHAGLILWAVTGRSNNVLIVSTPPLVVKTIALAPLIAAPQPASQTAAKPKASTKTVPPVKKTAATPKQEPKQQAKQEVKQDTILLDRAKEALRSLKQAPTVNPIKTLPHTEFTTTPPSPSNYEQELAQRLHKLVRLPEYGEVEILLTLNRDGSVDKIEILAAESEMNRQYIQKQLPHLRFLTFGKQFPKEKQHTFMLVLRNE